MRRWIVVMILVGLVGCAAPKKEEEPSALKIDAPYFKMDMKKSGKTAIQSPYFSMETDTKAFQDHQDDHSDEHTDQPYD